MNDLLDKLDNLDGKKWAGRIRGVRVKVVDGITIPEMKAERVKAKWITENYEGRYWEELERWWGLIQGVDSELGFIPNWVRSLYGRNDNRDSKGELNDTRLKGFDLKIVKGMKQEFKSKINSQIKIEVEDFSEAEKATTREYLSNGVYGGIANKVGGVVGNIKYYRQRD